MVVCYKEMDNWNSFPHKCGKLRAVQIYNLPAAAPMMAGQ